MNSIYPIKSSKFQQQMDRIDPQVAIKDPTDIHIVHILEKKALNLNPQNKCKCYHYACALIFLKFVSQYMQESNNLNQNPHACPITLNQYSHWNIIKSLAQSFETGICDYLDISMETTNALNRKANLMLPTDYDLLPNGYIKISEFIIKLEWFTGSELCSHRMIYRLFEYLLFEFDLCAHTENLIRPGTPEVFLPYNEMNTSLTNMMSIIKATKGAGSVS